MGIAYWIDPALGCTVVVWDGSVTAEQTTEHLLRLAADERWPPGGAHLADLTTVTAATLPDADLVDALTEGTDVLGQAGNAVVVRPEFLGETDLDDANASLGATSTAFTDLDLACAHLNLDAPTVRATIHDLRRELHGG